MPKMHLICDNCGKEYDSYQCGKNYHFCCIECRRQAGKLVSASVNEEAKRKATERIIWYNKNVFNHGEYRQRQADAIRATASGKGYIVRDGRLEHRIVAEQKLGRPLKPGEIVHHIDGNKRNNSPDNLEIMTQSEHMKEHLHRGGGKLAKTI